MSNVQFCLKAQLFAQKDEWKCNDTRAVKMTNGGGGAGTEIEEWVAKNKVF